MSISGLTQADMQAMTAAFISLSSKVTNSDIDWDRAMDLMGSISVRGAQERVRVAKKKAEKLAGASGGTMNSAASTAPAGGVDKKANCKVKGGPKKTKAPKAAVVKIKMKMPSEIAEESVINKTKLDV